MKGELLQQARSKEKYLGLCQSLAEAFPLSDSVRDDCRMGQKFPVLRINEPIRVEQVWLGEGGRVVMHLVDRGDDHVPPGEGVSPVLRLVQGEVVHGQRGDRRVTVNLVDHRFGVMQRSFMDGP